MEWSAFHAMLAKEAAKQRAQVLHFDWLNSPNNIAHNLLEVRVQEPKGMEELASLTRRIQTLPQELQDEIHGHIVVDLRQSRHRVLTSILDQAQERTRYLSKLQHLKLESLLYYANKVFQDHDSLDYIQTLCNMVRIFAIHKGATRVFLSGLAQDKITYDSHAAAGAMRIVKLAFECADLRSTVLLNSDIPTYNPNVVSAIKWLDGNLCVRNQAMFFEEVNRFRSLRCDYFRLTRQ